MHKSSLQKAGYVYVNIDEGWWLGERDAQGNIIVDPKQWPAIKPGERAGDMSNIVRYIHSLGLKAGIYTDAGTGGCSMYPDIGPAYLQTGSEGHYEQDFLQFATWGFDYVKIDWCGGDKENLDPSFQYAEVARAMSRAEKITGKRLYFSICEWGKQSPFTWAPGVGDAPQAIWRTGDDIVAPVVAKGPHLERKVAVENILKNFDKNYHPEAQHTGYYNDPDMMVVAMPGMDSDKNRLHLALWAIAAGPLLVGADLSTLNSEALADLANPDLIAINQDAAGLQGVKVKENGPGLEIWSKYLARSGERAILLLNRTYFAAPMHVAWADVGLRPQSVTVRDVWAATDLGSVNSDYSVTVPPQNAVLLLVRGQDVAFTHHTTKENNTFGTPETVFSHLESVSSRIAQVRINYRNHADNSRIVELHVNEQPATRIVLPPTRSEIGSVWIQVRLDHIGSDNRLTFTTAPDAAISSIDVN